MEPFEGVYDMDYDVNNHDESQYENGNAFALWFFGGSNDGCYCQSLMWKHWNWNGGYKPMVEDDNVLTITLTGVDSQTGRHLRHLLQRCRPRWQICRFQMEFERGP